MEKLQVIWKFTKPTDKGEWERERERGKGEKGKKDKREKGKVQGLNYELSTLDFIILFLNANDRQI